jgi:thiol-disulfide isomerase/thioredoxin
MKTPAPLWLLVLGLTFTARAELPAGWQTNYSSALPEAVNAKRPALLYFTASWCGPCKLMSRLTLTNAAVEQALSAMEHVAVDIDDHQQFAAKYAIDAVPTFVLLSLNGDEVRRTTGYQTADDFLRWLTNGISDAAEAAARHDRAMEKLAVVDLLLGSTDAKARPAAARELFGLCADRDAIIVRFVADRLKILAARDPSVLLDGLNDPRLATRVQVANALRDRLGAAFNVDPWSDPAERDRALQPWRDRLTSVSPGSGR